MDNHCGFSSNTKLLWYHQQQWRNGETLLDRTLGCRDFKSAIRSCISGQGVGPTVYTTIIQNMLFVISILCRGNFVFASPRNTKSRSRANIFSQNRTHSFILSIKLGRAQNQDAKPIWPALRGRGWHRAGSAEEEDDCYSHICVVHCHTLTARRHNGGLSCSGGEVYSGWIGGGEVFALHLLSTLSLVILASTWNSF
jgi:hypothetical protein